MNTVLRERSLVLTKIGKKVERPSIRT